MDDFDKQCPHSTQSFPLVKIMAEVLGEYTPDDVPMYEVQEEDNNWGETNTNTNSGGYGNMICPPLGAPFHRSNNLKCH